MARVAVVTGGTRGIGRAIAIALQEGRLQGRGQLRRRRRGGASSSRTRPASRSSNSMSAISTPAPTALKRIEAELGPVEVLVNNAGITRDTTMHRMSFEQWNAVIQTNLSSCFNMSRAVIDGMRERSFGRIVNIGSINGQAGQYGQVNYAAAKSGIHGFTKALAQEGAARGITVNAVAPGYVDTDMVRAVPADVLEKIVARIPVGRLGKAEDIARTVLFLVADDADFITGSTLSVNGGQHMY